MKHLLLILNILAVAMTAKAFSFSATTPTGQTLYYDLSAQGTATVVNPDWDNHAMPTGQLEIPASVTYGGTTYSVTTIGVRAFLGCEGLTRVIVNEGIRTIGTLAFGSCTALDSIALPSTIDSIASEAFNNCGYYNNASNWVDGSALYVGDYLVRLRTSFEGAFTVREGTAGIGGMAMYYCHSLNTVTLPASVRFVGALAFKDCAELDTIRLLGSEPPTLAQNAFEHPGNVVAEVPCSTLAAYQTAPNWDRLALIEAPCPTTSVVTVAQDYGLTVTATGIEATGIGDHRITVCDAMGRAIAHIDRATDRQAIALPTRGVFVVCIEGFAPRKVVYL